MNLYDCSVRAQESCACLSTPQRLDLAANSLGLSDGTNALPLLKGRAEGKQILNHVSLTDVSAAENRPNVNP